MSMALQTKKADAIDGLVMQSQNLYLTPSQPQLSSPPRVMTFMSSERILSSPLQNSPAQVPVGQLAKPADGEETEIDEDEHMEDDDESDDRGDAITINTTSSDDDDYMKEDLHQPIVLSETESDLSGDYHTSREEASPYIHTVDLIEPEVETTHRDPMSHLTTLERAILLLLLNAKGNGGAEGPSRGVHVAAITRAVKHKSERPEDVSDAMDNLLDYGLIATTIDVLHYEPVHLPDRPRALSA
ncbi:hypothetical protein BD410DRAFT_293079 [Rickenella mellea]|uniref:Replication protein A C-terminal domain-containing protein n=1 Tax=Rickenella mellea TaxID=50990 RepID=A0A4Y7Q1G5_9AGAM|nr:hypothetical protein BD410DRAFT_293079 [Rickenella mellea]